MKNLYAFIGLFALRDIQIFAPDMAFEPYGMFYGNVSPTIIDENVKPAYGGEVDAFLRKTSTTIYEVIRMPAVLPITEKDGEHNNYTSSLSFYDSIKPAVSGDRWLVKVILLRFVLSGMSGEVSIGCGVSIF